MKKELADYLNRGATKLKAKQPKRMSSMTTRDVFVLRDIVTMILGDDELRRQVRVCAGVSNAEMRRVEKGLNVACHEYLEEDLKKIDAILSIRTNP
jgi:hypothetical protein